MYLYKIMISFKLSIWIPLNLGIVFISNINAALVGNFSFGGHYYEVYDNAVTWSAARDAATAKTYQGSAGALVEINSANENTAIFNFLQNNQARFTSAAGDGGNARYAWIGANDRNVEGTWVWDRSGTQFWNGNGNTGSAVGGNYNNWGGNGGLNEPDDFQGIQDAGAIALDNWGMPQIGSAGQWNDIWEINTMPYIVEYPIPEPAHFSLAAAILGIGLLCRRHLTRK